MLGAGLVVDASDSVGVTSGVAEKQGDMVGRYLLLERIAEGGFGVVFRAEQQQPVKRVVALKVIKPGMDSKEVVARFELERQALAMMDHPNIARVYDAGATELGHPYFVMEFVEGKLLTTFCDERNLDLRGRLKLFAQICVAVQHAHQKGVIHRDLKPGNILVCESGDGEPVSKIIDFGVAKAIDIELTDKTFFTVFGRLMGTPRYMSPEQAGLNAVDVDTRSDIYSLGVVLYELMTGCAPLSESEMTSASFDELRQMIREKEPLKPSARVFQMSENERVAAASARQIEHGKFGRQLHGDLDWIVMKALSKDRDRRYDTAQGLALDVRLYLRSLPVTAGPPGTAYRMSKFVRRNRWPVITAVLSLLTLVAVTVAVVMALMVANKKNINVKSQRDIVIYERLQSLVLAVRNMRDDDSDSDSRAEALRMLGEVGSYPLGELVELVGEEDVQKLRSDARNELIACLLWTDLHEERLIEGIETPWPRAAMDGSHGLCALIPGEGVIEVRDTVDNYTLATRTDVGGNVGGPLRFGPEGKLLAAGIGNHVHWELMVWDWKGNQILKKGLRGVNRSFDFHPEGEGFVIGTSENTIRFFDRDGVGEGTLLEVSGQPLIVRYSADGNYLAVSFAEGGIVIIDIVAKTRAVLSERDGTTSLAWAPHGRSIVVGGADGSVTVLDRSSGKIAFDVEVHTDAVDQVAWSYDGQFIASGSEDGVVRLWDSRHGESLCKFSGWAHNLAFSRDGRSLGPVTPDSDKRALSILEVQGSPVCHRATGHLTERISAAAWTGDGTVLITGAEDGIVLWNRRGAELDDFPEVRVQPGGLACANSHLYFAEQGGISRVSIGVSSGTLVCGEKRLLSDLAGGEQIVLSPDGGYLAVACDTEVVMIDSESGDLLRRLPAPPSTAFLAISPDGRWMSAGTRDGRTVRVWELDGDGGSTQDLEVDGAATVAFFPLATHPETGAPLQTTLMTGDGSQYRLWLRDPETEKWTVSIQRDSEMANQQERMAHIAYSPRGTALVVSFKRKFLQVLNPKTLELMTQPGFKEQWPLAISPDGRMLTTEAANGRLFIWNLAELRRELKLRYLDWPDLRGFEEDLVPLVPRGG